MKEIKIFEWWKEREKNKELKNGCPKGDDQSPGSGDWSSLGMFVCVFGSLGG